MKGVIVYDRFAGHSFVPYGMRPGQQPLDIRSDLRQDWIPLEHAHSAIPRDVPWYHGCWVEVEASLNDVRTENDRIRMWRSNAFRRLMLGGNFGGEASAQAVAAA